MSTNAENLVKIGPVSSEIIGVKDDVKKKEKKTKTSVLDRPSRYLDTGMTGRPGGGALSYKPRTDFVAFDRLQVLQNKLFIFITRQFLLPIQGKCFGLDTCWFGFRINQ